MTFEYSQVELIMMPLDHKDDQGDLILPNFTKSINEDILEIGGNEYGRRNMVSD